MGKYCKFEREVYQVSYDNGTIYYNVVPEQTRKGELIERNSTDCGYEIEPIYRWYRAPATDYLCDGCPEYQERWVNSGDSFCVDFDKYSLQVRELSFDGGTTWSEPNKVRVGLIERNSTDCGYIPFTGDYLTFEPIDYCRIYFDGNFEFSLDSGETWTSTTRIDTVGVSSGLKLLLRKSFQPTASVTNIGHITSLSGQFNISGNIMSLIYGDDFSRKTSLIGYNGVFKSLFSGCTGIVSAENLKMPATTLAPSCYEMMFSGCTSMTTAPELPATTLSNNCYSYMFNGCSSLNYIKCLAANPSSSYTHNWVYGVAESGAFIGDSSANWPIGVDGIPTNWVLNGRWVNSGTTCSGNSGYDLYNIQVKEITTDSGQTWSATSETRLGSLIEANSPVCGYVPPTPIDYTQEYLSFRAIDDGTFKFSGQSIYYSLDDGASWTILPSNTASPTVNAGRKIMWKANLTPSNHKIGIFSSTGRFEVEGNSMSILFGLYMDGFSGVTSFSSSTYSEVFNNLFSGCTGLTSIENLVLPATTLTYSCYSNMFYGCTNLTTVPSDLLPATTLQSYCYGNMFGGCTSLTIAPELPATTLAFSCYYSMFYGCSGLTTAPSILPATNLSGATQCYSQMFSNCTSLTTAPQLPATTLTNSCYSNMFYGCTSLTTAPELPATVLTGQCYSQMFYGCTNLNYIKCLATDISASSCVGHWVYGVSSSGTFVKDSSMNSWGTGWSGIPSNWTIEDA